MAGRILAGLGRSIPTTRRHRSRLIGKRIDGELSHPSLAQFSREEGSLQLGTLGSGNHFIELQADDDDRLWLMIHSGSRAMGQVIREHHLAPAQPVGSGLKALDATTVGGLAYLSDAEWARRFAKANRCAMAESVASVVKEFLGASPRWELLVDIDHNHVVSEQHSGKELWVHRKGAMAVGEGVSGLLPGSMATQSFHVEGRGERDSLESSPHGAGRALSREAARRAIAERHVHRQLQGVWYDYRMARCCVRKRHPPTKTSAPSCVQHTILLKSFAGCVLY